MEAIARKAQFSQLVYLLTLLTRMLRRLQTGNQYYDTIIEVLKTVRKATALAQI